MERIRSLIPLNNKYYQGPELKISIGGTTRKADESLEKMMMRADDLMYRDKSIRRENPK